jgi:RHS repeat-associated protein
VATVTDTASASTSSYVYDAGGNRLLAHDATGATLYLPGLELHASTIGAVTATRYYSFGGAVVAQRTGSGVTWLLSDQQGTAQIAVDAASQGVTERRQKPFGDPRGTVPAWPNVHGYVGGTNDTTGLVHLGAREYDPTTGRFLSGDPVFDPSNPQQMLGYAYGGDSPVSNSDPSGQMFLGGGGGGSGNDGSAAQSDAYAYVMSGGLAANGHPPPPPSTPAPTKPSPPRHCDFWDIGCHAKQVVSNVVNWVDKNKSAVVGFVVGTAVGLGCGALIGWTGVGAVACGALAGAAGNAASYLMDTAVDHKSQFSWGGLLATAGVGALTGAAGAAGGELAGMALKAGTQALGQGARALAGRAADAVAEDAGAVEKGAAEAANAGEGAASKAASCVANSFVAGTAVLMADGTRKAIEDVKPGDEVLAGDPSTGATKAEATTATITGAGEKDLVDVTVSDGKDDASVVATAGHPFWSDSAHAWVPASQLRPGDRLVTARGQRLPVASVRPYSARQRVYNLSIEALHTFYVQTSDSNLLVHNCAAPRTFTSPDPHVADLANQIEARYPGHVLGVNVPATATTPEIDIETQNAIIEVKGGNGAGLTRQVTNRVPLFDKPVFGYSPGLSPNVARGINAAGGIAAGGGTSDLETLLEVLAP